MKYSLIIEVLLIQIIYIIRPIISQSCVESVNDCIECKFNQEFNKEFCSKCNSRYDLVNIKEPLDGNGTKCSAKPCGQVTPNCLTCEENDNYCISCEANYTPFNSGTENAYCEEKCDKKANTKCTACDNKNECSDCVEGFIVGLDSS